MELSLKKYIFVATILLIIVTISAIYDLSQVKLEYTIYASGALLFLIFFVKIKIKHKI